MLGRWLVDQFRSDLFDLRQDPKSKDAKPHLKINLAGLNRMRMRKLQVKLVQQVLHMRYRKTEPKGWEDLLEKYSKSPEQLSGRLFTPLVDAVKDYDFIRTCVNRGIDDPFVVITERLVDGGVLRSLLNRVPEEERKKDGLEAITKETFAAPVEKIAQPIGGTRLAKTQKQKTEAFINRILFFI